MATVRCKRKDMTELEYVGKVDLNRSLVGEVKMGRTNYYLRDKFEKHGEQGAIIRRECTVTPPANTSFFRCGSLA